jgi:hypothetical protein
LQVTPDDIRKLLVVVDDEHASRDTGSHR